MLFSPDDLLGEPHRGRVTLWRRLGTNGPSRSEWYYGLTDNRLKYRLRDFTDWVRIPAAHMGMSLPIPERPATYLWRLWCCGLIKKIWTLEKRGFWFRSTNTVGKIVIGKGIRSTISMFSHVLCRRHKDKVKKIKSYGLADYVWERKNR